MRHLVLLGLPLLAACAGPQERCIAEATAELGIVRALAAETRTNRARGYAVRREAVSVRRAGFCTERLANGDLVRLPCTDTDVILRPVPEAIDTAAEQRKLDGLLARLPALEAEAARAVDQCRAAFPTR